MCCVRHCPPLAGSARGAQPDIGHENGGFEEPATFLPAGPSSATSAFTAVVQCDAFNGGQHPIAGSFRVPTLVFPTAAGGGRPFQQDAGPPRRASRLLVDFLVPRPMGGTNSFLATLDGQTLVNFVQTTHPLPNLGTEVSAFWSPWTFRHGRSSSSRSPNPPDYDLPRRHPRLHQRLWRPAAWATRRARRSRPRDAREVFGVYLT